MNVIIFSRLVGDQQQSSTLILIRLQMNTSVVACQIHQPDKATLRRCCPVPTVLEPVRGIKFRMCVCFQKSFAVWTWNILSLCCKSLNNILHNVPTFFGIGVCTLINIDLNFVHHNIIVTYMYQKLTFLKIFMLKHYV